MTSPANNPRTRRRISIACRRCHVKKIKCDASEDLPCTGCRLTGVACVPIESRRGKYPRKSRQYRSPRDRLCESRSQPSECAPRDQPTSCTGLNKSSTTAAAPNSSPVNDYRQHEAFIGDSTGEPTLFAQVAEQRINPLRHPITGSERTVFLGEAFSLAYVVNDVLGPFLGSGTDLQKRLHLPVPEHMQIAAHRRDKRSLSTKQTRWLQDHGIHYTLPWDERKRLLGVYFEWFHAAFPILDRVDWLECSGRGEVSLLVENAVLMVAVTICSVEDLSLAGFVDRYSAREVFYRQARSLYDSDLDVDKIDIISGTFLLSFWWGGPDESKDSWYWLGIATSLAQGLGIHRSTRNSDMSTQVTRRWKRLWWSIRMREALVSGSIGRPQHFNELDCDIEMLQPEDLDGEEVEVQYACQMAHLCQILTRVITSRYASVRSVGTTSISALEDALVKFRHEIPTILQYSAMEAWSKQGLWAAMLMMAYNYTTVLLCRPSHSRTRSHSGSPTYRGNSYRAQQAANETTRIMEDILTSKMGRVCQIHTIPALFNSMAMHLLVVCNSRSTDRALAENRARSCMLGLNSLQGSWPVGSWVFLMFKTIMERLRRKSPSATPSDWVPDLAKGTQGSQRPLTPCTPHATINDAALHRSTQVVQDRNIADEAYFAPHAYGMSTSQGEAYSTDADGAWNDDWAILQSLFDLNPSNNMSEAFESFRLPLWDDDCSSRI